MKNVNEMVKDLINSGLTQKELAQELQISQPVISDLYREIQRDIGYERAGKKLETLHRSLSKKIA
jgi:predicted transcriptional regulator